MDWIYITSNIPNFDLLGFEWCDWNKLWPELDKQLLTFSQVENGAQIYALNLLSVFVLGVPSEGWLLIDHFWTP